MSKGLSLFAKKYPELLPRVQAAAVVRGSLVSWAKRAVSVESLLDRWISGLKLSDDMAIALSGVGTGSHIARLLEELPEGGVVFCAEPDCAAFARFLDTKLAIQLLEDPRVFWGVGQLDRAFFASMESFPVLEVYNAESVIFAPLYNENSQYYSTFFLEFARQLDNWRKLYRTNVLWSGLWQRNTIKNLENLVSSPDVSAFRGAFKGLPMIVASAGPSLDESLEFIRWAQSRAVIVAVNSSFRALRNAGIEPHFVLAADPHASTDLGFENVKLGRALLVCPYIVYPNVTTRFKGRSVTWSATNRFATYMRTKFRQPESTFITEQGTVSACTFDMAKLFGCPSMYFAGQDLAAKPDGQLHASDSFYTDGGPDVVNLDKVRWLPGNTLEKVPVEEKLYVYVKVFEEMAHRFGDSMKLVNLSRYGARIEGLPYVPLNEAKNQLPAANEVALEASWNKVEATCNREWMSWSSVKSELYSMRDYAENVCSKALRGAMFLEQIDKKATIEELAEAKKMRDELTVAFQSNTQYGRLVEDGQLKAEMLSHKRVERLAARYEEDCDKELEIQKSFFWAIAEGAYHFLGSLDVLDSDSAEEAG